MLLFLTVINNSALSFRRSDPARFSTLESQVGKMKNLLILDCGWYNISKLKLQICFQVKELVNCVFSTSMTCKLTEVDFGVLWTNVN